MQTGIKRPLQQHGGGVLTEAAKALTAPSVDRDIYGSCRVPRRGTPPAACRLPRIETPIGRKGRFPVRTNFQKTNDRTLSNRFLKSAAASPAGFACAARRKNLFASGDRKTNSAVRSSKRRPSSGFAPFSSGGKPRRFRRFAQRVFSRSACRSASVFVFSARRLQILFQTSVIPSSRYPRRTSAFPPRTNSPSAAGVRQILPVCAAFFFLDGLPFWTAYAIIGADS